MINAIKKPCIHWSSRGDYAPEIIVVHISTGSLGSMDSWFGSPGSLVSAHYGVGKDGSIHQYVAEDSAAWHAGRVSNPTFKLYKKGINPNLYTIGIENEGLDLSNATPLQLAKLMAIIKDIASRWNIPIDRDHIIGHYQVFAEKPFCPSPDHTLLDKIVSKMLPEERVCVMCPKSKVDIINNFLNSLT